MDNEIMSDGEVCPGAVHQVIYWTSHLGEMRVEMITLFNCTDGKATEVGRGVASYETTHLLRVFKIPSRLTEEEMIELASHVMHGRQHLVGRPVYSMGSVANLKKAMTVLDGQQRVARELFN
jgi:hypothetical protein